MTTFVDLRLNFTTIVEGHDEVKVLLNRAKVALNWVHDKRMIQVAQNIKLALRVIFIAWLQRD